MLQFKNAGDFARAREVLAGAEYSEQRVAETLGGQTLLSIPAIRVPPWLRAMRGLSPHETLVRLFHLGEPAPQEAVARAVAPMDLDTWVAAGLLAPPKADGSVAPRVKLMPALGGVFAADMPWIDAAVTPEDYVMPPGALTLQLAYAMVGRPARRALDLGTGCGALAHAAAEWCDAVVATDKNPRAVEFARFNVRLNGLDRVECLAGDLFEPVDGQRFDRIVCNPPFVITPERRLMLRDSGMRGDTFCRHLIGEAAGRLEEGGYFQMMGNYAHLAGQPWQAGLAEWFAGLGCDALVWVDRTEPIADYAMTWIISTESQDVGKVPQLFDQWMAYYDGEGIEAVSYIAVALRRRSGGANFTAIEELPRQIAGPCGDDVLRAFHARDFLGAHASDDSLLPVRVRLHPAARLEQQHAMTADGLRLVETQLRMAGGLRFAIGLDPNVAALIARCDGQLPLKDTIAQLTTGLGLDPQRATTTVMQVVRPLIERGVLLPVEEGEGA